MVNSEKILIRIDAPVNPVNKRYLVLRGTADGTTLTRLYNDLDIQGNYIHIVSMRLAFFNDNTIWIREGAWDDKSFTANANSRYSTIRGLTRIDHYYHEKSVSTNNLKILIDNQQLGIFSGTYFPIHEKYDLNILPTVNIQDGIDAQATFDFYDDMESNTVANPIIEITLEVIVLHSLDEIKKIEVS